MKIWLVSIFENTPLDDNLNTRFNSIAKAALDRGHQVTFWASTFKHNTKDQRFNKTAKVQHQDNLDVIFVESKSYKKNISLQRIWSHHSLSKKTVEVMESHPKPDIILSAYPPVTLTYEVSRWASTNNIPVVADIIDPWPDNFGKAIPRPLGFLEDILFYPMRKKLKKSLEKMSGVTAISKQYIRWAKTYWNDISYTSVFYPAVDMDSMQRQLTEQENKVNRNKKNFTIIYAGSLASSYDIPCILDAAKILNRENMNIQFKIAGDGPQKALVNEYCTKYSNLTYYGRLSKEELMREYYLSDLGLTQHVKGATQSVTYKLFDLFAAGLPILNSLESEMKNIIVDNRVGLHNDPGDANKLAENIKFFYNHPDILEEFKQNGLKLTKKEGAAKKVYSAFVNFLEKLANVE